MNRARARTLPSGVSIDTQSPSAIPRACAAAGCSATSGYGARLRRLGSARCWVWQNSDDFALVRTSGKRAARSGRATGPIGGSDEIGQRRVAVIEERLRVELDLARRRREAARRAVRVGLGMLGVAGLQRHAHAARGGAQLLQR